MSEDHFLNLISKFLNISILRPDLLILCNRNALLVVKLYLPVVFQVETEFSLSWII